MSRPTINDVARIAGVSGTVSRVLNSHPRVSKEAREAVLAAIAETGYQSNAHARSLALGRTNAIALIIADARDQLFKDPTFTELIEGVRERLAGTDVNMVLLLGASESEDARTLSYIRAGHFDGLIHLNPYLEDPIAEGLKSVSYPIVLCGPRPPFELPERNFKVTIEDADGVRQALDHLAERGGKTIAMIGGQPLGVSAGVRFEAYKKWCGDRFDPDLYEPGDYGIDSGRLAMEALLERRPDIDAVFCASDRMAQGALETAYRRGRRVPDDLLVMGFDDHELAKLTDPPLSTIRQPIRDVGRTAMESLLAAMAGENPPDIVFPVDLVIRGST